MFINSRTNKQIDILNLQTYIIFLRTETYNKNIYKITIFINFNITCINLNTNVLTS